MTQSKSCVAKVTTLHFFGRLLSSLNFLSPSLSSFSPPPLSRIVTSIKVIFLFSRTANYRSLSRWSAVSVRGLCFEVLGHLQCYFRCSFTIYESDCQKTKVFSLFLILHTDASWYSIQASTFLTILSEEKSMKFPKKRPLSTSLVVHARLKPRSSNENVIINVCKCGCK